MFVAILVVIVVHKGLNSIVCNAELTMGQWVMGHGSNGSPKVDGSHGSWVKALDPLTHQNFIFLNKNLKITFKIKCQQPQSLKLSDHSTVNLNLGP